MLIETGDLTTHYVVDGPEDAPWVVLSNSLATSLDMWHGVAERLSGEHRVLRYDQRGHGRTTATPAPYSFEQLVGDLEALLDALEIERTWLVGLSMGGTTALGLTLRAPHRVAGLALCDTPAMSTPAGAAQWAHRCELARAQGMDALVEPTIARWFPAETLAAGSAALDRTRRMIADTPVEGFCGGAAALSDVRYAERIEEVTVPAAFVVGAQDGVLPTAMRALHERLRGSRYVEIAGAGHLSALERPAEFASALVDNLLAVEVP